jgi:hypothetical protein
VAKLIEKAAKNMPKISIEENTTSNHNMNKEEGNANANQSSDVYSRKQLSA